MPERRAHRDGSAPLRDPVTPLPEPSRTEVDAALSGADRVSASDGATTPIIPPDHYELGEKFAEGGLGRILKARDRRLDRVVAIKELRRESPAAQARFEREVRITARLQHPNIIPVHEAGRWPTGGAFYAMKLVDGTTLGHAISTAVSLEQRLSLLPAVIDVAEAIAYAHSEGVIHRDLKPANVLVGPFGETVVIDWGLAKELDEPVSPPAGRRPQTRPDRTDGEASPATSDGVTGSGAVVGTPAYMPPEQAAGRSVDATADVYSLGAILYHVIGGQTPYSDRPRDDIVKSVVAEPPKALGALAPGAPADLVAIVSKAMAREAKDRYPTAREMAEELRRFATGRLVGAYRYTVWDLLRRFVARHRAAVVTAAVGAIALITFGAVGIARIARERDRAERSAGAEALARHTAERRVDELVVEKARSLLERDPTRAVAWLKRLRSVPAGAATVAARAEDRGVARRVLREHDDVIVGAAFSGDGRFIATAGHDGRIVVWEARSGRARRLSAHSERATVVRFSPDSARLVSASYDGTVQVWTVPTRTAEAVWSSRVLTGHEGPVKELVFSPDGRHLASLGEDGVRLWDAAGALVRTWKLPAADRYLFAGFSRDGDKLVTGSHRSKLIVWSVADGSSRQLVAHSAPVRAAAFAPDGAIASAGEDGKILLWKADGRVDRTLRAAGPPQYTLAFSPDGAWLATAGMAGSVDLWDVAAGTAQTVTQHNERVAAVAFSRDGRLLASGGWDRMVRVHDLRGGNAATLRGHGDVVSALAFGPDGRALVSGSWDKTARLWALRDGEGRVFDGHAVGVHAVDISPDGRWIASGGHDNVVRCWHTETGENRSFMGHTDHVFRVAFSPDSRSVASSSDDRTVRIWSLEGDIPRVLTGHTADVEEIAYSPNGTELASAAEDATARLWRLDGSGVHVLPHGGNVTAVAFDASGRRLATASRDRTVRLWDTASGREVAALRQHADAVEDLAFSSDSTLIGSVARDGRLLVWNPTTGKTRSIGPLPGAHDLAFSSNGRWLAVAGHAPRLWLCPIDGTCSELRGHRALVRDVAFASAHDLLLSASGDGTVALWDLATHERRVLEGHTAPVFDVVASSKGDFLASASGDGTVRLWRIRPPPAVARLMVFLDELTAERVEEVAAGDE